MKPPADELERRRPVWEALSSVFLDTELNDAQIDQIAAVLRASGYTEPELARILWDELCPVLHVNMGVIAGEWEGFDMSVVEREILRGPAGLLRRWWSYLANGRLARHDWDRVRRLMAGRAPVGRRVT